MKKILIYIFLFLFPSIAWTQNLVHNPSMENFHACNREPSSAYYWWDPTGASSDYMHECLNGSIYGVPNYIAGYQNARTGKAYMRIYGGDENFKREYVAVELKDSLIANTAYCVSFYVNTDDVRIAVSDEVSIYFTSDSVYMPTFPPNPLLGLVPQYTSLGNGVIDDTARWVNLSGSFIAQGGEKYAIIGSFFHDINITYIHYLTSFNLIAMYYIDDVSVYPCDAPVYEADGGEDIELCYGDSVELGTHNLADYMYWWYDESGNLIDSSGYTTVSPEFTTTYKLVVKDFKFKETIDYVTVYVEDCATFVPNIFSPNGDGNNDVLYVLSNYIQSMQFVVYNRWGEKVFETKNINEGWNGKYNGEACSPGVFVWYLEAVLLNGETIKRKGNVSLVR